MSVPSRCSDTLPTSKSQEFFGEKTREINMVQRSLIFFVVISMILVYSVISAEGKSVSRGNMTIYKGQLI